MLICVTYRQLAIDDPPAQAEMEDQHIAAPRATHTDATLLPTGNTCSTTLPQSISPEQLFPMRTSSKSQGEHCPKAVQSVKESSVRRNEVQ
mmetsp:Transcript_9277/g.56485  ORF Transcript_9277/g.56485 Transcript_9277/m.56485 type:complete len:91 (+) Transcript_9277:5111-5383(+)